MGKFSIFVFVFAICFASFITTSNLNAQTDSKKVDTLTINSSDLSGFNDPVIDLNIKSVRDAYAFEKKLGSKISYFPQRILIKGNLLHANDILYDSIMVRPGRPAELPGFVIFTRIQKYDYPLNVIYEYNVRTNIVSCIYYEWAPQWIHYPSSYQADTAIENSVSKYASNKFYKDKQKQLYKLLMSKFKMYPGDTRPEDMPMNYDLDSLLENQVFESAPYFGENESFYVNLQYMEDIMDLYPFVSTEYITKPFRGLILGFFLKKNVQYDSE